MKLVETKTNREKRCEVKAIISLKKKIKYYLVTNPQSVKERELM